MIDIKDHTVARNNLKSSGIISILDHFSAVRKLLGNLLTFTNYNDKTINISPDYTVEKAIPATFDGFSAVVSAETKLAYSADTQYLCICQSPTIYLIDVKKRKVVYSYTYKPGDHGWLDNTTVITFSSNTIFPLRDGRVLLTYNKRNVAQTTSYHICSVTDVKNGTTKVVRKSNQSLGGGDSTTIMLTDGHSDNDVFLYYNGTSATYVGSITQTAKSPIMVGYGVLGRVLSDGKIVGNRRSTDSAYYSYISLMTMDYNNFSLVSSREILISNIGNIALGASIVEDGSIIGFSMISQKITAVRMDNEGVFISKHTIANTLAFSTITKAWKSKDFYFVMWKHNVGTNFFIVVIDRKTLTVVYEYSIGSKAYQNEIGTPTAFNGYAEFLPEGDI
ncbi:hypothetical protein [Peribacillus loiseleuriae]|uniref:hypothetical protein n=1 Tax=Peribacillus loiseleuriae TaxID=1679170 RepID=UPI003CFFACBB